MKLTWIDDFPYYARAVCDGYTERDHTIEIGICNPLDGGGYSLRISDLHTGASIRANGIADINSAKELAESLVGQFLSIAIKECPPSLARERADFLRRQSYTIDTDND